MIVHGDCVNELRFVKSNKVAMVFADPPFGINEAYVGFKDTWPTFDAYLKWVDQWLYECTRILKPDGSLFIQAPASIASFIHVMLGSRSMWFQQEIIWHFNFGAYQDKRFINAHTRILWFTKQQRDYKWRPQLIPSTRLKMGDSRTATAKYSGMVPYNTVWSIPRIQGNNKERRPFGPNQIPEEVIRRLLLSVTDPQDLVVDPFCGTGTTHIVCDRYNRECITIEISAETAEQAKIWLQRRKQLEIS